MNKIKNFVRKKNKSKIVSLTAYSKNIASVLDNYCDLILVGDSLGSVLYNYKSTREVTLNTMIEHSKSVRMGIKKSLMIVDMPHNTYRNPKEALKNAKLIMKNTKCDGVKLEGGKKIINTIKTLVKNNIPYAPYIIGSVLTLVILAGGAISGGHYNPAVSFMFYLSGKLQIEELFCYIISQVLGATLSYFLIKNI